MGGVGEGKAGVVGGGGRGVRTTLDRAPPGVIHARAKRKLFFARVGRLHPRFDTPVLAMSISGAWAITLIWGATWITAVAVPAPVEKPVDPLDFLLNGVVFVDWLAFGACGVALLMLQRRLGERAGRTSANVLGCLFIVAARLVAG